MKNKTSLLLLVSLIFLTSNCDDKPKPPAQPDAVITNTIVSTQLVGNANDEDSTTPAANYSGASKATDKETEAESFAAKSDEVSGKAKAVPFDPAANTVTGDMAIATSNNKVVTEFVVNKQGQFTFDLKLDISKVELVHDGKVFFFVRANILDQQGQALPQAANAGIAHVDFEFRKDGANPHKIVINNDENDPDAAEADGDYNKTLSGPNGGVNLAPGKYRLEMDLRIRATAPVQVGPDNAKHSAKVDKATLTVKLR